MQVTAAVLRHRDEPFTSEDIELAAPGPVEIRVRIAGVGLCHTDVLPRLPDFIAQPPIILGHEAAGVVEAVGGQVHGLHVGDHVVLSYDSCHICDNCSDARHPYCREFFPRNLTGLALGGSTPALDAHGHPVAARRLGQSSFASHALTSSRNAVRVDPDIPLHLLGPLGCGVQTGAASVQIALGVGPGESLIVFGCGAVGLSAVLAARIADAKTIVAVDINTDRTISAGELGATHAVDGSQPDLLETLLDITGGGADYVVAPRRFPLRSADSDLSARGINDAERDVGEGSVFKPVLIPARQPKD